MGAWYSSLKKKVGIFPSLWLLERSRQKCYRITLSTFTIHLPRFVQIRLVFEELYLKMSLRLITISLQSYCLT